MTITINLPPETEEKIRTQAQQDGVKVDDYVKTLIAEAAERRERIERASEKSFQEILAPVHKEFEESGMSEEELTTFLEELREEVWQERQQAK